MVEEGESERLGGILIEGREARSHSDLEKYMRSILEIEFEKHRIAPRAECNIVNAETII